MTDRPWIGVACLSVSLAVAATAIERSGLLLLASAARSPPARSWARRWWCWLDHFKLGLGALVASLALSWWLRVDLLSWLLAPQLWGWGEVPRVGPQLYFGPGGPPYLLAVCSVAWIPAVPFLASDVWGLLRPLLGARAARLQIPFAVSSLLVVLAAVLIVRQHSVALFGFLMPFQGGELSGR